MGEMPGDRIPLQPLPTTEVGPLKPVSISEMFAAELEVLMRKHEESKVRLDEMISTVRSYREEIGRLHNELLELEAEL